MTIAERMKCTKEQTILHLEFERLGLKKIIATHYDPQKSTYKLEYAGGDDENVEAGIKTDLTQNGDFRSPESIALLQEADIIVTNPPFSLFREYVAQLIEYNKKFIILGNENYILKSPVRRIHKIRTTKPVKETIPDESMEIMRDNVAHPRDLAIIDMLASTGMRVGELCKLNRNDIDFERQECIVLGKGDKERVVYFDARAKVHLQNYLNDRDDDNPALFVSLIKPYRRLEIPGVELRLRKLGRRLDMDKVHPHKFRRTLATKAIDKGMPVEQLQTLLGHSQINTTMEYAIVNQTNVKTSHKKYIA